jgi:GH25 family lysozyme M1 (1,4-beta-N-acetylmuramidase)
MTNAIGVDVSKYNLGWSPDKAIKPIDFVIQRASWASYKDNQFDAILPEVQKIAIRGAYHYYCSGVPWKVQADLFLSVTVGKGFHFYVLDYEGAYNNLNGRTIAEASEFVKYIKAQTGKRCAFYFSPNIWNTAIRPYNYATWCNGQDVWIAQYPWTLTQTPPYQAPKLPTGLTKWSIWQYGGGDVNYTAGRHAGADYGGGLVGIDLNYFNGTKEQMKEWANVSDKPTPTPTPSASIGWLKPRYVPSGPAIIAASDAPRANHPTIALDSIKQAWIKSLNLYDEAVWRLFTADNVGPTKGINSNGKMIYIPAGWSGNVVKIIDQVPGWVKVESIDLSKSLPNNATVNHRLTPWLVHRMTTVSKANTFITYPARPDGKPSAWDSLDDPLFSEGGEFWLPSEWVQETATTNRTVNIRTGAAVTYAAIGTLPGGTKITSTTTAQDSAGNIWGMIGPGRWCCLRYYGTAYCDWVLK